MGCSDSARIVVARGRSVKRRPETRRRGRSRGGCRSARRSRGCDATAPATARCGARGELQRVQELGAAERLARDLGLPRARVVVHDVVGAQQHVDRRRRARTGSGHVGRRARPARSASRRVPVGDAAHEHALPDEIGDEARRAAGGRGCTRCPTARCAPSCMMPISSASANASCWSCVTRIAVVPAALEDRAHLDRQPLAQVDVEVRERLVEQQQVGLRARAPARARRAAAGRRRARADRRRPAPARPTSVDHRRRCARARSRRGAPRQSEGDVARDRQVREQRVVLEHHADARAARAASAGPGSETTRPDSAMLAAVRSARSRRGSAAPSSCRSRRARAGSRCCPASSVKPRPRTTRLRAVGMLEIARRRRRPPWREFTVRLARGAAGARHAAARSAAPPPRAPRSSSRSLSGHRRADARSADSTAARSPRRASRSATRFFAIVERAEDRVAPSRGPARTAPRRSTSRRCGAPQPNDVRSACAAVMHQRLLVLERLDEAARIARRDDDDPPRMPASSSSVRSPRGVSCASSSGGSDDLELVRRARRGSPGRPSPRPRRG